MKAQCAPLQPTTGPGMQPIWKQGATGRGAAVPLLAGSQPWQAGRQTGRWVAHRRSVRKVSSTAGSSRPMLESLSMLSPSRLRGSICSSSSKGKGASTFRLTSGIPVRVLPSSLNRLEPESSGRGDERADEVARGPRDPQGPVPQPRGPGSSSAGRVPLKGCQSPMIDYPGSSCTTPWGGQLPL